MVKNNKYSRIGEIDIINILNDLNDLIENKVSFKLTWEELSKRHGFSRQSLQSNNDIKQRYKYVKNKFSNKSSNVKIQNIDDKKFSQLIEQNSILLAQVEYYKNQEELWMLKWQRIAYNLRLKGISISDVDNDELIKSSFPSKSETNKILSLFDEQITPIKRS